MQGWRLIGVAVCVTPAVDLLEPFTLSIVLLVKEEEAGFIICFHI